MESSLHRLLPLFERERIVGQPLALATVLQTAGSTYRKAGAQMLIAGNGDFAGLLSGGCLEGDLREHAGRVLSEGSYRLVSYDMRGPDDLIFGLGAGCEGAMDIFLQCVGPDGGWQPLARLAESLEARRPDALAIVVESGLDAMPPGTALAASLGAPAGAPAVLARLADAARRATDGPQVSWFEYAEQGVRAFITPLVLPPNILLLGAGPDAASVAELAAFLGWHVTVVDHRSAYTESGRFPRARRIVTARPLELLSRVDVEAFSAAIVMSHHLESDGEYLRQLAHCRLPYVGLLGPSARRERLLADLGPAAERLRRRLRAPIGLDIGARTPESIALAIIAEVHAALESREGRPFSATA